MSTKNLEKFFEPSSVAIVGATDKKDSVARTLTKNLTEDYEGEVYLVNPNRKEIWGFDTFRSVKDIPEGVDLACIITPAQTVPQIVQECGEADIPALIIISSGFRESDSKGRRLEEKIKKEKEKHEMRILGPNSLGVIRPSQKLNATISDKTPDSGRIAFISQSGALGPSIIDRQKGTGVGFSTFASVGNMIDVDFGDLIDYFGKDIRTNTILMHVESVTRPEKFMSAAKNFSRTCPVVLEKSGIYPESSKTVASHIGSSPGKDSLYDALFNRTGVVRVDTIDDLFGCSEALAHECLPTGPNLAIITNAGGPGIMAVDALIKYDGKLAPLSDKTKDNLRETLPRYASKSNPIDISSDASLDNYVTCVESCRKDENVDGILVIYTPHGIFSPESLAEELADLSQNERKPILACWLGGRAIQKSKNILRQGGIPTFSTPRQGSRIFMYMYRHLRNRELLYETPEPLSSHDIPVKDQVHQRNYLKSMMENLMVEDRRVLMEEESKKFLQTYGIPAVEAHVASSPEKAVDLAEKIGFPVVLKVRSPSISQKRKVQGVKLDLRSGSEVRNAFNEVVEKVEEAYPSEEIRGVTVQRMIEDIDYEIMLGSEKHQRFGSYIFFGRAGFDGKLYQDEAVDFPPLNQVHASRLMERTQIVQLIKELDDEPSEKIRSLQEYLARLSQLIIDLPEIEKMEFTLAGCKEGLSAIDARICFHEEDIPYSGDSHDHLIIEPYPLRYVERRNLKDDREVTIRPIRPEDEPLIFDLFESFSKETIKNRFFSQRKNIDHNDIVRFTSVDYEREIRLVAEIKEEGKSKIIGMGSISINRKKDSGEFAVVVGDSWQGLGLGTFLIKSLINVAKDKGLDTLWGVMKRESFRILHLCKKFGFQIEEENTNTVKMIKYFRE